MKLLYFILVIVFISCSDNKETKLAKIDSSENLMPVAKQIVQNFGDFSIAWVDSINARVFVVIDSSLVYKSGKINTIIQKIKILYDFGDRLNVSFFSGLKYANYKTDVEEKNGIPYYEFYLNYLGEFTQRTKEYWTYPGLPDKKLKYIID